MATAPDDDEYFETELVDLSEWTLDAIPDHEDVTHAQQTVTEQVKRPRNNLGGSGPPGRED